MFSFPFWVRVRVAGTPFSTVKVRVTDLDSVDSLAPKEKMTLFVLPFPWAGETAAQFPVASE